MAHYMYTQSSSPRNLTTRISDRNSALYVQLYILYETLSRLPLETEQQEQGAAKTHHMVNIQSYGPEGAKQKSNIPEFNP